MAETARESEDRWQALEQLDEWLRTPMLALALLWLGIVLWELLWGANRVLELIGLAVWVVFLLEFALRFALAPAKLPFLRRNWLVALALAVPALRLLRGFALLRAARALQGARALRGARLVRIVGTANRSMNALRSTLRRRGFGYVLGLTALVILLGAAGMLSFEPSHEVEGGFASYGEAVWWTGMLVSTMGSGFWPVTTEGRLLAFLLSVYGLGVFGYVAAAFASFFVGRDAESGEGEVAGAADMRSLAAEIAALRRLLESQAAGRSA